MKTRYLITVLLLTIFGAGLCACATTPKTGAEIQSARADVREMADQTLARLYQNYPNAREEIRKAAGYGVFSNFGFKILFMGSSNGEGIVVDNVTKREIFIKMFELSPGFGFGAQKFSCVLLFETQAALDSFVNSGWEFGGNVAAALQTSTQGDGGRLGVNVSPGVRMYQLSDTGAIIGISLTGAKYYKDDELN